MNETGPVTTRIRCAREPSKEPGAWLRHLRNISVSKHGGDRARWLIARVFVVRLIAVANIAERGALCLRLATRRAILHALVIIVGTADDRVGCSRRDGGVAVARRM